MSLRRLSHAVATLVLVALPAVSGAGQAHPTASPFAGEYFVTENRNPVCVPYTRNLNQFRRLDFDVCHPRLSEKYPEFTRPAWEEISFDLGVAETVIMNLARKPTGQGDPFWTEWLKASAQLRMEGKLKLWRTRIDVDGDGQLETILRLDNPFSTQYSQGGVSWTVEPDFCPYRHSALYRMGDVATFVTLRAAGSTVRETLSPVRWLGGPWWDGRPDGTPILRGCGGG